MPASKVTWSDSRAVRRSTLRISVLPTPHAVCRVHCLVGSVRERALASEVIMQVRDIMTPNPSVVTRSESVVRAAALMRDRHIGMLPVVDDLHSRQLVGVLTDRDIIVRCVARERDVERPVRDLMTSQSLAFTHVDSNPEDVVGLMNRRHLRRIPVLDDLERVVGVVSSVDVSKRFAPRQAHVSGPQRVAHEAEAR